MASLSSQSCIDEALSGAHAGALDGASGISDALAYAPTGLSQQSAYSAKSQCIPPDHEYKFSLDCMQRDILTFLVESGECKDLSGLSRYPILLLCIKHLQSFVIYSHEYRTSQNWDQSCISCCYWLSNLSQTLSL